MCQISDFKSWSRSGVWQKNLKKNVGPKEFWVPKNVGQNFFGKMKFGFKKVMGPKHF